jgi:peptidoglycan/LPS O-acetylase OafA/YrhL
MKSPIYLNELNGIRAIAALAVLISHVTKSIGLFGLNPFFIGTNLDGAPKGLDLAGFRVSMFFVLSGFLITYLSWEENKRQPIDIKKFMSE